jgi:hypothetical protein
MHHLHPLLHQAIHLRRSLDRSYYQSLSDRDMWSRDVDQVLFRHTKQSSDPQLIMVDQLWLWTIDGGTAVH